MTTTALTHRRGRPRIGDRRKKLHPAILHLKRHRGDWFTAPQIAADIGSSDDAVKRALLRWHKETGRLLRRDVEDPWAKATTTEWRHR